ncbi:hypothetical protein DRF62_03055 [Chryseobacterium piscium]|uniref:Uncharacterized protein n=1 Tax=Chryseobacterium piscium TaxID=333702 RepID=A0A3D9BT34_9FLAO|nr:hypothetical protein DRF62_03055 [Chryseobacterium piscium]
MGTTSFFLGMEKPHRFSKPMRFSFGEKRYSGQREIAPEIEFERMRMSVFESLKNINKKTLQKKSEAFYFC